MNLRLKLFVQLALAALIFYLCIFFFFFSNGSRTGFRYGLQTTDARIV